MYQKTKVKGVNYGGLERPREMDRLLRVGNQMRGFFGEWLRGGTGGTHVLVTLEKGISLNFERSFFN